MHFISGKTARIAFRPFIRRQVDARAAAMQFMRQRFGRKQMAAGTAGAKQNRFVHQIACSGVIGPSW